MHRIFKLATAPAQIQVGTNHQARLPALIGEVKSEEKNDHLETLVWHPNCIMDCDLLMYLRAARSMAAFVGWCDGGSTDDGCAAASMDETTIKSLHTLHQHNYDTGKALQAFVKIINPKSVDKRWSDEDAKKFVRGLKQHGKNFFKIRKELLPYKDTASLVEYYYLWKKTPAASTTRPHRRHRRPAFRRQAPTPTLPQGDDMDDVSSASEASEMESEEECQQTTGVSSNSNHNHHEVSSSCSRCSVTKSSRWYEAGKDSTVCADCHHSDEMLMSQNDEEAPPNCDLIGAVEDDVTRVGMDEDAPPFMFRPVKEDEKMSTEDLSLPQNGNKSLVSPLTTETEPGLNNEDATTPAASPVDSKENVASILSAKEEVTVKDESEELKKGIQSLLMANNEEDQNIMPKKLEQAIKTEEKMKVESLIEEPTESSKWFGFPSSFTPTSSFPSQQSVAPPPLPSVAPPSVFDVKPPRAVASVAPTFQDAPSLSQQSVPSFQLQNSPVVASSNHQQSSFRLPSPHDICSVRRHVSLPLTTSSYPTSTHGHSALHAPQTSSHLPPSPTPFLPASTSSFLPHLAAPSSYHQPIPVTPSAFSSTSAMPEDMSIRKRETPMSNMERPVSNSSSYKNMAPPSSQQQQQQQQQPICHNISDDDDDEDDCNVTRSPSPEPTPASDQVYDSTNSIFIRRWNRGQNTCSRCDFEFIPSKNSNWAIRKEEKMMQKSAPSSSNSHHHHHHHQPHHNKSTSHHSVLKDGRRDGRKEEDKNKSPMTNRSSDAQITSSLIGGSHHLPPFAGPSDRMPSRPGLFHDPTPALSQLSAYARPHIGNQRCLNYSLPPPHSMEPYFRMPGMYPPGSRDVLEMDIDKHLWERDLRDRDFREMEFMEKMKQEMELKSAAAAGFDRLSHIPSDPIWADMQRRFMNSQLALSATAPPPPGHLPGIFQPAGNLSAELIQRERLEQLARIGSQEQMAAAARDGALLQIYQRYAQDPVMLQRQIQAYMANKAQESVHLVYHFAKADPLASAVSQASGMGGTSANGLPSGHIPPPSAALHSIPQNHPFLAFARDQERIYMELLSRPPYSTDPMLAQQVLSNLTAQAAAQQEALQRQLALERDYPGNPMLH